MYDVTVEVALLVARALPPVRAHERRAAEVRLIHEACEA
jgi:hypothetical protein